MKLSNTILINNQLLPNNKKAFTLAEVLITLTILGVVAAITIPSLVNRQGEVAARTRLKKAIASYENVAAVYMVENEATTAAGLFDKPEDYFKTVTKGTGYFVTSDGAIWYYTPAADNAKTTGSAIVCDSDAANPTYCVPLWTGVENGNGTVNPSTVTTTKLTAIPANVEGPKGKVTSGEIIQPDVALKTSGSWEGKGSKIGGTPTSGSGTNPS